MRRRWPRVSPVLLLALLSSASAGAQNPPSGSSAQPGSAEPAQGQAVVLAPRAGITPGASTALPLREAIRMALESNNDVTIARLQREAVVEDIHAAEGAFDPRVLPTFSFQHAASPVASAIGGAQNGRVEEDRLDFGAEVNARSPWAGGRLTFDFTSTRLESSNQNLRLNPQFPSNMGVSYLQPLLRGRTLDQERREILIARRALDLSDAQVRRVLIEQLTLVEQAYWDLVFATRFLEVQATALGQARAQVASNERQAQAGTLAIIDVVEAQTQVANFEQTVATAQQTLTQAENRLKSLVLADREAALWNQALVPADLSDRPVPTLSVDAAMALALARRPELAELDAAFAQNDVEVRFASDQARPQLDLVGNYRLSGLAGEPVTSQTSSTSITSAAVVARLNELAIRAGLTPFDTPAPTPAATLPDFFVGGMGDSWANIWRRRFPTASVQIQAELPIRNRTARANLARARIVHRQLERQRTQLQQTIEVEVRNALQAVATSDQRHSSAGSARRSAQEQYDSERRRFESGLSTVFLVLERQTALVTAQAQEVRARADLNQAMAELDRAIGATLERHGLQMTPNK